ncbi:MAG: hypothetical protein ISS49_16835, partial [Anaerolineae bacterium]|nr:hypothetical protein [Anaerolineae bacterium]
QDGETVLAQKSLGQGLALHNDGEYFTIFQDHVIGLEYIRSSQELCEKGLYVELGAYKYQVFLDFCEVRDNEWRQYAQLTAYLNGRGVPSIEEALREVILRPVHYPFRELVNARLFRRLIDARESASQRDSEAARSREDLVGEVEQKTALVLREVMRIANCELRITEEELRAAAVAREVRQKLEVILHPKTRLRPEAQPEGFFGKNLVSHLRDDPVAWPTLLGWLFTHALAQVVDEADFAQISRSWIDEWLLGKIVAGALGDLGLDEGAAWQAVATIKILTSHQRWFEMQAPKKKRAYQVLESWLRDDEVQRFLQVNRHRGILWFNKEAFDQLLWWMLLPAVVTISADPLRPPAEVAQEIVEVYDVVKKLQQAEEESGYQVERLLEAVKK